MGRFIVCRIFPAPTPRRSKYPPAKPGALVCEPLKAAAGSLARPRKTTRCCDLVTCHSVLPRLSEHPPYFAVRDVSRNVTLGTRREPSRSSIRIITNPKRPYCGVCQTFAASPAEPGGSQRTSRHFSPRWNAWTELLEGHASAPLKPRLPPVRPAPHAACSRELRGARDNGITAGRKARPSMPVVRDLG
jgi:hypothetical protein